MLYRTLYLAAIIYAAGALIPYSSINLKLTEDPNLYSSFEDVLSKSLKESENFFSKLDASGVVDVASVVISTIR